MVRVTSKGQATIPKELRERFGISAPGEVDYREVDGRLVVEPRMTLSRLRGIAKDADPKAPSVQDLLEEADAAERRRAQRMDKVGRRR